MFGPGALEEESAVERANSYKGALYSRIHTQLHREHRRFLGGVSHSLFCVFSSSAVFGGEREAKAKKAMGRTQVAER